MVGFLPAKSIKTVERLRVAMQDPEAVRRQCFKRLFPGAANALLQRAFRPEYFGLSYLLSAEFKLRPSLAFINDEKTILITDQRRLSTAGKGKRERVFPVIVLGSRSDRARVYITSKGEVIEFKGLTPFDFNPARLHPQSHQPVGLFGLDQAQTEVKGLSLLGGIDCGITNLGERFPDMEGFAQVYRKAKPGEKYLSWLRMDTTFSMYVLLAELEGVPIERFLYEAGKRFGEQLRTMHTAGYTLHFPFQTEKKPFFSDLHSGNVEIHGNILDLEGMVKIEDQSCHFLACLEEGGRSKKAAPEEVQAEIERRKMMSASLGIICRASDLYRFVGGGEMREPSLFGALAGRDKSPEAFFSILKGILNGYYFRELAVSGRKAELDQDVIDLGKKFKEVGHKTFGPLMAFSLLSSIENELGARLP